MMPAEESAKRLAIQTSGKPPSSNYVATQLLHLRDGKVSLCRFNYSPPREYRFKRQDRKWDSENSGQNPAT